MIVLDGVEEGYDRELSWDDVGGPAQDPALYGYGEDEEIELMEE